MINLPTAKQTKGFLKDNKKTILTTTIAIIILYVLGIAYTLFSNGKVDEIKKIDPATGLEVKTITSKEYTQLLDQAVRFDFYVENSDGGAFANSNLLESVLLSPAVSSEIDAQEKIVPTIKGDIPLKYMLDVSADGSDNSMHITVSTGDYKKNLAIAKILYATVSEKTLPLLNNKNIYMLSEPHKVEIEHGPEATEEKTGTGALTYAVLGIGVCIGAIVAGILIAFARLFFKKEITDVFSYRKSDDDTLIDLTHLAAEDNKDELAHSIQYPAVGRKLILSEQALPSDLQAVLIAEEIGEDASENKYVFAQDITAVDPQLNFDEIIIVSQKNITAKSWYNTQRIQLENYPTPIKIILL